MATSRNTDINLIIRARTEADKAIGAVAGALDNLYTTAEHADGGIEGLGRTLSALDKASAIVVGSVDKAGAALDRQTANITENKAALAALVAQQEAGARAAANLQSKLFERQLDIRHNVRPAGDDAAILAQIRALTAEQERLAGQADRVRAAIANQETQLKGAQSSLLQLSATSHAIADGQAVAEGRIHLTTRALEEQAAAAARVSDVQRRINSLTGVDRPDRTGSASAVADILAAADAEFRRAEGIRAAKQAEQERNNVLAERAQQEAAIARNTGSGRPRATDAGATFSALDDRERQRETQELREAAHAYELFEARVRSGALALKAEADAQKEVDSASQAAAKRNAAAAYEAFEQRVRDGAAALREEAEAERRAIADAQALRDKLDPLAAIQRRLNDELVRYRRLAADGRIESHELAAAEKHLADEAKRAAEALGGGGPGKPKLSLFGLKPYELQNLGYQVNDVVTQLASGTSLSQTLAQQGGQILQLFPKVGGAVVGALTNPAVLAGVTTFGLLALSIKTAADQSERLRNYSSTLGFRADGDKYNAQALSDQQRQLERTGATAKDAQAAITAFLDESVAPDKLTEFTRAARSTAEALGTELPDAAKQVAEAFTGGYDAIARFDDKLNFLSASEREHIRTLFEEGRAGEARTEALRIYVAKQDEAAQKARGSWAGATRELGGAVSDLLDLLANTAVVQGFTNGLSNLAAAARAAIGDIRNVGDLTGTLQEITDKRAYIARLDAQIAANPGASNIGATKASLDDAKRGLTTLINRYNDLAKAAGQAQVAADGTLTTVAGKSGDTVVGGANTPRSSCRTSSTSSSRRKRLLKACPICSAARSAGAASWRRSAGRLRTHSPTSSRTWLPAKTCSGRL